MQSLFILSALVLFIAAVLAWTLHAGYFIYYTVKPLSVYEEKLSGQPGQAVSLDVTDEMRTQYNSEGFVVLRNVLPKVWVDHVSNISATIEQYRTQNNQRPLKKDATNVMYSNWHENSAIQQFWFESGIAEVVAKTVGAKEMRLFEDIVIVANPADVWYGCWHADTYSFGNVVESDFSYSVWLPLVDIPAKEKGGSLQICNSSTILHLPENCNLGTPAQPLFGCEVDKPIYSDRDPCENFMKSTCEVPEFRAGDAVIFKKDTVHRTQQILDPSFRRHALIGRFVDGRATYRPMEGTFLNSHTWRIQHDMCNHQLQYGEVFKGPCFPRLHPEVDAVEATSARQYMQPSIVAALAMYEKFGGTTVELTQESLAKQFR